MSDMNPTEISVADAQGAVTEDTGHGRHRGEVSAENDAAIPHGRHRKPSDQPDVTV
ncbi:hypothetical protein [Streptomyces minutiscleroticus]|nr:hypothetical protein [Streptomyces minutiscleroticus]